jgi:hypothetical protein
LWAAPTGGIVPPFTADSDTHTFSTPINGQWRSTWPRFRRWSAET